MYNRTHKTPTKRELFTGAKTSEYAIFYTIALEWISDYLTKLYGKQPAKPSKNYDTTITRFLEEQDLNTFGYLQLKNYLWKGYRFNKNKSGEDVDEADKKNINAMIKKVEELRNFHSHYYHDNSNLIFDEELVKWIESLKIYALDNLQKEYPREVEEYNHKKETFFVKHDGKFYINQEGRNFFLSFFLKSSEMTHFLQQRKGCKRNDKPEFKIKHKLYKFYTHRDGATSKRYSVDNEEYSDLDKASKEEITKTRQLYKLLSYLNDVPSELLDTKLFPLQYNNANIETTVQLKEYIEDHNLFNECVFSIPKNKEGQEYTKLIDFKYRGKNFRTQIKTLHKLILDVYRDDTLGERFYRTLNTFAQFREEFPEKLNQFFSEEVTTEEINEYYIFKLRASDKTRGRLANIMDSAQRDDFKRTKIKESANIKELNERLSNEPIELNYANFFFESDQKVRMNNQFMQFSVDYLIHMQIVPQWQWLIEKFENEEVTTPVLGSNKNKNTRIIKQRKKFCATIEEGYRLCIKNNSVIVKLKDHNEYKYSIGETTMRNIMVVLLLNKNEAKNISSILELLHLDLTTIKQAAQNKTKPTEELNLLNTKTMPRYLRIMMRDDEALKKETIDYSRKKAKERYSRIIEEFKDIPTTKTLTRKEINTQLIRCYKLYDWKYPKQSEYKFLRQNEYQLMSIYHYSLAKGSLTKYELSDLRNRLFVDIKLHLPQELKVIFEECTDLKTLFETVLKDSIKKLKKWKNKSTTPEIEAQRFKRIGIHVPLYPSPDKINDANIEQMKHLPLMIHPSLIFKVINEQTNKNRFVSLRKNNINKAGLNPTNYNIEKYLEYSKTDNTNIFKPKHSIIGKINNIKTIDILIYSMLKQYLENTNSDIFAAMKNTLKGKNLGSIELKNLYNTEFCIYESSGSESEYKVKIKAKFKQLNDYMILERNKLSKLSILALNRYPKDKRSEVGIILQDKFWEIPFIIIKQTQEDVFQQSLMVMDFIFDFEKGIIDRLAPAQLDNKALNNKAVKDKEYISFMQILESCRFDEYEKNDLKLLRNSVLHFNIPEEKNYIDQLKEPRIKKILAITPEKMKKYEKKSDYYMAKAMESANY